MSQSISILAVPHQLQGPKFTRYVNDSSYLLLVERLIHNRIDLVFEEAARQGPSIAEELTNAHLGEGHYIDIDPPRSERHKYGIAKDTETSGPIDPWNSLDMYARLSVQDHRKREELWLKTILGHHFQKGLLICGVAHGLSFAFRLLPAGIGVELYSYIPYKKLGV